MLLNRCWNSAGMFGVFIWLTDLIYVDLGTFHSRHHRLYVPYAFGALYNHPFEGFLLDTLGAAVGYKVACLSTRQGMWFFTCSIIKTVDDHCGYSLPWDPLQRLTSNNAGYHDIHHQSWGIKVYSTIETDRMRRFYVLIVSIDQFLSTLLHFLGLVFGYRMGRR